MRSVILAAAAFICAVGCSPSKERLREETKTVHLPPDARNVVILGNHWYTFELDVGGKTRKFMYRARYLGTNGGTETITELRD